MSRQAVVEANGAAKQPIAKQTGKNSEEARKVEAERQRKMAELNIKISYCQTEITKLKKQIDKYKDMIDALGDAMSKLYDAVSYILKAQYSLEEAYSGEGAKKGQNQMHTEYYEIEREITVLSDVVIPAAERKLLKKQKLLEEQQTRLKELQEELQRLL